MGKRYIHYGHKGFDRNRFRPIKNHIALTKPDGGFWASPIDAEYGWKKWCDENDFRYCGQNNCFTFTLSPGARVLTIRSADGLDNLPQIKDEWALPSWCMLDFENLMEQGYDAVELELSADWRLYMSLYGWDCDSILIMNPDVIVEV